jgi:DNA invertase Pin-like site-specific DNA recombinase
MKERAAVHANRVVLYARVSSKDQEKEGFSIPAQLRLLREYAASKGFVIAHEFTDVETAKESGRTNFGQMLAYLKKHVAVCRTILVEKTDRLYRNIRDYATVDELGVEIHLVKENEIISPDSRSSEQFVHGIKVLMARNYSLNLGEETIKGMTEKARAGIYPSYAPVGYGNVGGGACGERFQLGRGAHNTECGERMTARSIKFCNSRLFPGRGIAPGHPLCPKGFHRFVCSFVERRAR